MSKYRQKLINFFNRYKVLNGCSICSQHPPHYLLCFHHTVQAKDNIKVSNLIYSGYSIREILKEIEKYKVRSFYDAQ